CGACRSRAGSGWPAPRWCCSPGARPDRGPTPPSPPRPTSRSPAATRSRAPGRWTAPRTRSGCHRSGTARCCCTRTATARPAPPPPDFPPVSRIAQVAATDEVAGQLVAKGYALAGSAYGSNGWAVADGVKAGEQLHEFFVQKVGRPNRTYVWGDSLGGLV